MNVLCFRCTLPLVSSFHRDKKQKKHQTMSGYYYQDTNGYNGMQQGGYSQQNSVDEYMMPEEEWEREAVLDPAWERQQKKVR